VADVSASDPRTVDTCELRLYDPTTAIGGAADFTFGQDLILEARTQAGAQRAKGQAEFVLDNAAGAVTNQPTRGQRVEFEADLVDGTTQTAVLLLKDITVDERDGTPFRLRLRCEEYVPGILDERVASASFVDRAISGAPDAIVETLVDAEAPDVGTAAVQSVGTRTDLEIDNEYLWSVIRDLAVRGDAAVSSVGTGLQFVPAGSLANEFDLADFDFFGDATSILTSDGYASRVVVDGGEGLADVGSQTTHDATEPVSGSTQLVRQLSVASDTDELAAVDLWIGAIASGGDLLVALQDQVDGSGSVAAGSRVVDLARTRRATSELTAGAWARVELPGHALRSTAPALVIAAESGADVDIGVRASDGTLAYRAWEPTAVRGVASDQPAADTYRRVDTVITDNGVQTQTEADALAQAELADRTAPPGELTLLAKSPRLRDASAGDRIDVQYPDLRATEQYVVVGRERTYDGTILQTSVSLETRRTI
jgi:hypothetical protein